MLTYIIRRLLLIPPTLLGITAVVFFVMAMTPGGIGASLLTNEGSLDPYQKKILEAYYKKRYDLDKPLYVQYLKWLNKVSPIGFKRGGTPIRDPVAPAVLAGQKGAGNLPPGTYSVVYSYVNAAGETAASPPANVTLPSGSPSGIAATIPSVPANATRVQFYVVGPPSLFAAAAPTTPGGYLLSGTGDFGTPPERNDTTRQEGFPLSWTFGFKWPDLGESFSQHRPVSAVIQDALPVTLLLETTSLPLIYGIAIWTGIMAARARGKVLDVGLGTILIALWSMPEIWIGVLMIGFLTNRVSYVHLFPSNGLHDVLADNMAFLPSWGREGFNRGWLLDTAWHLVLPLICLSYGGFAFLSRLQRGALLDSLTQDFVRTARAKGLSERVVLYRHAFRNSLMPLITVAANILPGLIGGSVIVETIFGVPGMGKLSIDAVFARDRELLLSLTLIASLLQLFGFLIADLSYAVADPRVSYVD